MAGTSPAMTLEGRVLNTLGTCEHIFAANRATGLMSYGNGARPRLAALDLGANKGIKCIVHVSILESVTGRLKWLVSSMRQSFVQVFSRQRSF
jgi:hypothetical protein